MLLLRISQFRRTILSVALFASAGAAVAFFVLLAQQQQVLFSSADIISDSKDASSWDCSPTDTDQDAAEPQSQTKRVEKFSRMRGDIVVVAPPPVLDGRSYLHTQSNHISNCTPHVLYCVWLV